MKLQPDHLGLRWQAKRDPAFAPPDARIHTLADRPPKALSPLRFAGAIQIVILALTVPAFTNLAATNSPALTALVEFNKSVKSIPFKEVILATTQHHVMDFDSSNPVHQALFQKLAAAAAIAADRARTNGLFSVRANEAGNHMEAFVKTALEEVGLRARTPVTAAGKAQTTGYPDVEILGAVPCYLELKTYSATTVNTTQRSFYYSPSENPKVTHDALHLLLGYELQKVERAGKTAFVPTHWKLITLQDLEVDLKFEFNQSNRRLYGKDASKALLGEQELP